MPTEPDTPLFWERQPGETAHQYAAFVSYRDQGITRSLRRAADLFYSDGYQGDTGEPPPEAASESRVTRFKRWSRELSWVARAEAFDAEEARVRSLRRQKEREEMLDDHAKLAKLGVNLAAKKVYDIVRGEDYLPSGALPQFINAVTQLHRLSLGEPTEVTEARDPDRREPDYSELSYEEIVMLDELSRKLYGDS